MYSFLLQNFLKLVIPMAANKTYIFVRTRLYVVGMKKLFLSNSEKGKQSFLNSGPFGSPKFISTINDFIVGEF